MNANAETQSLSLVYDLAHPPAKVWRALTEPELLAKWVMANDMKPSVGHAFTFRLEPTPWWDGIVYCEVLRDRGLRDLEARGQVLHRGLPSGQALEDRAAAGVRQGPEDGRFALHGAIYK